MRKFPPSGDHGATSFTLQVLPPPPQFNERTLVCFSSEDDQIDPKKQFKIKLCTRSMHMHPIRDISLYLLKLSSGQGFCGNLAQFSLNF